ncbi:MULTISPECIES: TonB-dependent receptor [Delftia]|uniref:TonB-dependent siderophore receptor n=1 Tax=Delftia TaxID=80865 RepID=UPI00077347A6|nr:MULTISPECIES: TonB-dependent receptor [Delftia]MPT52281.1 TonB-dependent siderophore receptor [Delftia sp.]SFB35333.1 outer-membrane receptor for ferric coprogen and ferric-rhodotorulic acid [Delftia tsuruhatensis]
MQPLFMPRPALALAIALMPAAVLAQAQRSYDVAAGPLDAALRSTAAQAGVALIFTAEQTAGQRSAGLRGSYTVEGAFEALLAGTAWQAVRQASGAYALRRVEQVVPAAAAGATLATVNVTAAAERSAVSEGTGSYATRQSSTATRLGLSQRETPQSVSVVTRQLMDDQGLTSLPEVLEKTPGITVGRNDSERTTFYSRGYAIENFQFDGVPNTMDSANQYTTSLADSAIYDRVEVVKGATGLLTGAGYPSAVVNLVRKRPTKTFQASAEAAIGSHDRLRGVGDISAPLTEDGRVRARVVAVAQNARSHVDDYSRNVRSLYGIIEADLGPGTVASLGIDHMQTRADGASFGHIPLFFKDGSRTHFPTSLNPAARWSYWDNDSTNVFAELKHSFGNGWKMDLSASRLRQSRDVEVGVAAHGMVDPVSGLGINMLSNKIPTDATTQAVNAALSGPLQLFGREHELSFGASWSRQRRHAPGYSNAYGPVGNYFEWDGQVPRPDFQLRNHRMTRIVEKGVFGAARLRPTDDLSVILGARVSWYDMLDDTTGLNGSYVVNNALRVAHKTVPYAGVVYDLNRQLSLYASQTDIFNPQTYYKDAAGSPLPPLTGRSREVGVKGEFLDGRLNASLALFHIQQRNAAQYVSANPQSGEEVYAAIDGVTSKGVEMEVSGSITPAWNIYGGYTYRTSRAPAQPDVILSAVNTNQPRHLFKLSTSYRLNPQWTVGGSLAWQSLTYYQQSAAPYARADQRAYALVGLMARYDVDRQWSVTLNVNNLFDKTYMPGLGSYGTGVYGDPRNVLVTARYRF